MRSRLILSLVVVFVTATMFWLPSRAMFGQGNVWQRTRQDDELIAVATASKDPFIGVVYLAATPGDTGPLVEKIKDLGGSVEHLDTKIGYIRALVPTENAYAALEVPAGTVAGIDVDLTTHGGQPVPQATPPANEKQLLTEINSKGTQQFLRAPSPILHDLGGDVWRAQHPTYDGRGVLIADIEFIVDPMVKEFSGALSLDGKPVRKIEGLHIIPGPEDRGTAAGGDASRQWVPMPTSVSGQSSVRYNGVSYVLPYPGTFRIGTFDFFSTVIGITHWMNPIVFGSMLGNGKFTILWDQRTGRVWVDRSQSHNFRAATTMTDYNAGGTWSYFGSLQPSKRYPLIVPAVSFVVFPDAKHGFVGIGLGIGQHATGVTTSAAGHNTGPNDPVHGVAPAAQVASFEYDGAKMHSQAEALIAAAEDPKVDVIVYEWDASIHTTSEEGWFIGALNERLARTFGKAIFVPGDNQPALASIDDGGFGRDVIAVSGSQSADSYWRYDGFRPAVPIHKHWGGLTDGPGQDGSLKPDLLAPSGYTAGQMQYVFNTFGARSAGLYTLPSRYQRFGGTSQATPTAGGAAALLFSAAKQAGLHVTGLQIAEAMRLGAYPSTDLRAHEEGNGLINIARSWEILRAEGSSLGNDIALACGGSVHTPRWPNGAPDGNHGIFESLGWHPGDSGSRSVTFCFPHAPAAGLHAAILLNDGTFGVGAISSNGTRADVAVHIAPHSGGMHSAIVQLQDVRNRVVGRAMVAVVASLPLTPQNHYSAKQVVVVPRPGYTNMYVDVPKGTDALTVQIDGTGMSKGEIQDPTGTDYKYIDESFFNASAHHSLTIPSPTSGQWEIMIEDIHDVILATRSLSPVVADQATISVAAVRANRSAPESTESVYAKAEIHEIGSVQILAQRSGNVTDRNLSLIPLAVPKNTNAMMIDLTGTDPRVDAYVLQCKKVCAPIARLLGTIPDKHLTIPDPSEGSYVIALDDYDPAASGSASPTFALTVLGYNRLGSPSDSTGGHAYEVNCNPPGGAVVNPQCGLFLTKK